MKTTDEIMKMVEVFTRADTEEDQNDTYDVLKAAVKELVEGAARYQWLCANVEKWSWQPSRYNAEVISGFSAKGTGYIGHKFGDAVDAAMWEETP